MKALRAEGPCLVVQKMTSGRFRVVRHGYALVNLRDEIMYFASEAEAMQHVRALGVTGLYRVDN